VVGIIAQGALAPAGNGNFLAELLVKFTETCYIRTGCFDKVFFFFMIEMDLMIDYKRYTLSGSFENYRRFSATRVWQKWRFSAPQTHLRLIKVWFSASTFVMKIATFEKPANV
jgi:hypothetical protein